MGLGVRRDAFHSDLRVNPENQFDAVKRDRVADVVDLFSLNDPKLAVVNFESIARLPGQVCEQNTTSQRNSW